MHRLAALALISLTTGCAPLPAAVARPAALMQAQQARTLPRFTADAAGFATHTYWHDTGREVVVFDAQFTPALAERAIAAIKAQTKSPITYVVVTHANPDKFNGAPAFQAIGAKVVASTATAAAIPAVHAYKQAYFTNAGMADYPAQATVDLTFDDTLQLPGVTLKTLKHAGVATSQTVAHIPAAKALIVGDLVHHGAHAWLEGPIVGGRPRPDLTSWAAALDELRAFPGTTVYGGRGQAAPVAQAVSQQQAYLRGMDRLVTAYVADVPRAALTGPDAGTHWAALTKAAEKAFPGYDLGFMVTYGVYGLALARAR